ncbi:acetyl-CoA carboxylase biotin carboxyl carrier protein [Rhodobacteraceae bacterium NNCM2]|nr:acetyl-CoA carboxylase biotin carboxyl carrier protein [Coraliihabitans acroporae]
MTKNSEADVAFIKALADVLRASDLTELEVTREYGDGDGLNVRLSRTTQVVAAPAPVTAAAPAAPAAAPAPAAAGDAPAAPDLSGALTSPMVGTAYLAPEPDAPPFVSVGDKVNEGDTLMIIEAMKTMNQIPAPRSGTIKQILVANGEPVEFGAPLMIIA